VDTAKVLARERAYDSGEYERMILTFAEPGSPAEWAVATAKHSWFVEVGTGIHGPFRRPVLASETTRFGYFRFVVMDGGSPRTVYTDKHQGRPARHIMRDAAVQVASAPGLTWNAILT